MNINAGLKSLGVGEDSARWDIESYYGSSLEGGNQILCVLKSNWKNSGISPVTAVYIGLAKYWIHVFYLISLKK